MVYSIRISASIASYFAPLHPPHNAVSASLLRSGEPVDWVERKTFLSVRNQWNKAMIGGEDAAGPWDLGLATIFADAAHHHRSWLAEHPHSVSMIWTGENDGRGFSLPRFDAFNVVFANEGDALLFKLTCGGSQTP